MITEDGSLLKRSSRKGVNPEVPVTVEEREIVNPGIAELEYPLRALLLKLFPHVEADEYSLMVGEGLSATIPTLVMRAAINDTRLLDGKDPLPLIFLDVKEYFHSLEGPGRQKVIDVVGDIKKTVKNKGKKALVVTEYMQTGITMGFVKDWLEGIPYDVGVMIVSDPEEKYRKHREDVVSSASGFFVGYHGQNPPDVWMNKDISAQQRAIWQNPANPGFVPNLQSIRDIALLTQRLVKFSRTI